MTMMSNGNILFFGLSREDVHLLQPENFVNYEACSSVQITLFDEAKLKHRRFYKMKMLDRYLDFKKAWIALRSYNYFSIKNNRFFERYDKLFEKLDLYFKSFDETKIIAQKMYFNFIMQHILGNSLFDKIKDIKPKAKDSELIFSYSFMILKETRIFCTQIDLYNTGHEEFLTYARRQFLILENLALSIKEHLKLYNNYNEVLFENFDRHLTINKKLIEDYEISLLLRN